MTEQEIETEILMCRIEIDRIVRGPKERVYK